MAKKPTAPVITPVAAAAGAAPLTAAQAKAALDGQHATQAAPTESAVSKAAGHRVATASELGGAFARAALREASDIATFAESVKANRAHIEYVLHVAYREAFKGAATAAGYADADSLWSRTWKAAKAAGYLADYPKAATEAATKKAGQREAAKKAEEADKRSPVELMAAAKAATNPAEMARLAALAKKRTDEAAKAATEKAKAATEGQVKSLRAAIDRLAKAGDTAKLAQLLKLAQKLSPEPAAAPV